jgi:hypothetical protein
LERYHSERKQKADIPRGICEQEQDHGRSGNCLPSNFF